MPDHSCIYRDKLALLLVNLLNQNNMDVVTLKVGAYVYATTLSTLRSVILVILALQINNLRSNLSNLK
jgi:hypothetical protein